MIDGSEKKNTFSNLINLKERKKAKKVIKISPEKNQKVMEQRIHITYQINNLKKYLKILTTNQMMGPKQKATKQRSQEARCLGSLQLNYFN